MSMRDIGKIVDVLMKIAVLVIVLVILVYMAGLKKEQVNGVAKDFESKIKSQEALVASCKETYEAKIKFYEAKVQSCKDSCDASSQNLESRVQACRHDCEAEIRSCEGKAQEQLVYTQQGQEQLKTAYAQIESLTRQVGDSRKQSQALEDLIRRVAQIVSVDTGMPRNQEIDKLLKEYFPQKIQPQSASVTQYQASGEVNIGYLEDLIKRNELQLKKEREKIKELERQLKDLKARYEASETNK